MVYEECDKWCLCFIKRWSLFYCKVMFLFYCKVRDEYRTDYDEGRGGYGKIVATKITQARDPMWHQTKNKGQPVCVDLIDLRTVLVKSSWLKLIRVQSSNSFQTSQTVSCALHLFSWYGVWCFYTHEDILWLIQKSVVLSLKLYNKSNLSVFMK